MKDLVYALILVVIGCGLTWRAVARFMRVLGVLLVLAGSARALWAHPTRTVVASEHERTRRLCQSVAIDLGGFKDEHALRMATVPPDGGALQRTQWAALAPALATVTRMCTADPQPCLELLEEVTLQGGAADGALDELARAISTRTTCSAVRP